MANALANVLVQGNGVAEAGAARMRRGGEEAIVRGMAAINIRVGDAAENREVAAMLVQQFEVGRQWILAAPGFREEMFRQQSEVIANAEHAARLAAGRFPISDVAAERSKSRR